jgi:hypothetical protein
MPAGHDKGMPQRLGAQAMNKELRTVHKKPLVGGERKAVTQSGRYLVLSARAGGRQTLDDGGKSLIAITNPVYDSPDRSSAVHDYPHGLDEVKIAANSPELIGEADTDAVNLVMGDLQKCQPARRRLMLDVLPSPTVGEAIQSLTRLVQCSRGRYERLPSSFQ